MEWNYLREILLNRPATAVSADWSMREIKQEVVMSEKIRSEMISRRGAFMLLGSAAAFSVAVPVTIMTATDAEARVGNPASAVSVAGANRRDRRQDRRYKKKKKKPTDSEKK
jgi:hypothetical protein